MSPAAMNLEQQSDDAIPADGVRCSPLCVLHVLGRMDRGGAETWLMHMLRGIDRRQVRMDFLVHSPLRGVFDDEIRGLGSRILTCPGPNRPWSYVPRLRRILREAGPFDVVHSHVHHFSGVVLAVAASVGVPIRIAHSHNDMAAHEAQSSWPRRAYLRGVNRLLRRYATAGLACSSIAARDLYGSKWESDPRWRRLLYGIDLSPFTAQVDRAAVRRELELPPDALVVGHVGRFVEQKNHSFLVEVAAEVARREPRAHFVLAGDGPLRESIAQDVRRRGLASRFRFLGVRPDVARLMLGGMDLFLFPSRFEGLGIVLVEAQSAGLPCVFTDTVPEEADVVAPLVHRQSLAASPAVWAETVLAALRSSRLDQATALAQVRQSPFDVDRSLGALTEFYRSVAEPHRPADAQGRVAKVLRP
jgi:glycosyltransferase involved in cell wall biosynthesis